jgi:hypothetical protein
MMLLSPLFQGIKSEVSPAIGHSLFHFPEEEIDFIDTGLEKTQINNLWKELWSELEQKENTNSYCDDDDNRDAIQIDHNDSTIQCPLVEFDKTASVVFIQDYLKKVVVSGEKTAVRIIDYFEWIDQELLRRCESYCENQLAVDGNALTILCFPLHPKPHHLVSLPQMTENDDQKDSNETLLKKELNQRLFSCWDQNKIIEAEERI